MSQIPRTTIGLLAAAAVSAFSSCVREQREFRPLAPATETVRWTRLTNFEAGEGQPTDPNAFLPPVANSQNAYEENAFAVSEGKRLFSAMNCVGCLAHGGGGMGPALMDDKWIYGYQPQQVFSTIVEGRPNGMPAWGRKLPAYQIWQLCAYVRSMSGLTSSTAASGRDDDMQIGQAENSRSKKKPGGSPIPKSAEITQ